jgi:hypothetical protein
MSDASQIIRKSERRFLDEKRNDISSSEGLPCFWYFRRDLSYGTQIFSRRVDEEKNTR